MMNDVGLLCWDEKYSANRTSPYELISFFFPPQREDCNLLSLAKKKQKNISFKKN